jgi:hypothetical protein
MLSGTVGAVACVCSGIVHTLLLGARLLDRGRRQLRRCGTHSLARASEDIEDDPESNQNEECFRIHCCYMLR